jgi:hypothetical protein
MQKFEVDQSSTIAADLLNRKEIQKFHEFSHVYRNASWLFDFACELMLHL